MKSPVGGVTTDFQASSASTPGNQDRSIELARLTLDKLVTDGENANINEQEFFTTFGVIIERNPRLAFQNQKVPVQDPRLGEFTSLTQHNAQTINKIAKSVGRLNRAADSHPLGTCFHIGDGRLLTNLHVIKNVATRRATQWELRTNLAVSFADDGVGGPAIHISSVDVAGADDVDWTHDSPNLEADDYAVLVVKPPHKELLPPAMKQVKIAVDLPQSKAFCVGYSRFKAPMPFAPGQGEFVNGDFPLTPVNATDSELSIKYYSAGTLADLGEVIAGRSIIDHDCSTRIGGSGGPLVIFGEDRAIGLHIGMLSGLGNVAHTTWSLNTSGTRL